MRGHAAAVAFLLSATLAAADRDDVATSVGIRARPAMIKIMTDGPKPACLGNGTAFFISPDGLALTAGHVVPKDCPDLIIRAHVEGEPGASEAIVVKRSALDAALIRVKGDKPRHYISLQFVSSPKEVEEFLDRFVTVVGFDLLDEPNSYATSAKVTAVHLEGDPDRWSLTMFSANQGRSGSPVILDDGSAVAILVELPKINQQPAQGRARIIPLSRVADLNVETLARTRDVEPQGALRVNLAVSERVSGGQPIDEETVAMKGDEVVRVGTDKAKHATYALRGYNIRRRVTRELRFKPKVGHEFVLESVRFSPLTVSPLKIEPKGPCSVDAKNRCWEVVNRELVVRLELFPGNYDGASSWIEGELATEQVPVTK